MMQIISFGHSALYLADQTHSFVIDPGKFADAPSALARTDTVLLTHEHPDHMDLDALTDWLAAGQRTIIGPASVINHIQRVGSSLHHRFWPVTSGEQFTIGTMTIMVGGAPHAPIHPQIPSIEHRNYLISSPDLTVYHPGDSLSPVPPEAPPIDVLCVPVAGPWLHLGAAMDFTLQHNPRTVIPIHGALLSDQGWIVINQRMDTARIGGRYVYRQLAVGEAL